MKFSAFHTSLICSLATILAIFLVNPSCNKATTPAFHLPQHVSVPMTENTGVIKNVVGARQDGSLIIYHTTNGEILISFVSKENKEATMNFILQTTGSGPDLAKLEKIESAELLYMRDFLLVNDLISGQLVNYRVNTSGYQAIYSDLPDEIKNQIGQNKEGYGLAYHNGTWGNLHEKISLKGSLEKILFSHSPGEQNNLLDPTSAPHCSAGGEGSTSCSIGGCPDSPTQCNTACAAGFYSCCRCNGAHGTYAAFCTCIKNPVSQ